MIRPVERKVAVPQLPEKGGLSMLHRAVQQLAEAHNHHDDMINSALRGGTSASNNSLLKFLSLSVQMPTDAPWAAITGFLHSFANAGSSRQVGQVLMLPGGLVRMRGVLTMGTSGQVAFVLPALHGPGTDTFFGGAGIDAFAATRVQTSGGVKISTAAATLVTLESAWLASPEAASPYAFIGPGWPLLVKHGFQQCTGLEVDACQELSQNAKGPAPLPMPAWQDVGNGQLRLDGLWGLQWGKKYQVRLRMTAES